MSSNIECKGTYQLSSNKMFSSGLRPRVDINNDGCQNKYIGFNDAGRWIDEYR